MKATKGKILRSMGTQFNFLVSFFTLSQEELFDLTRG